MNSVSNFHKIFLSIYFILFILVARNLPAISYITDIEFWQHWADRIFTHGLGSIYQNDIYVDHFAANYPPLVYYFLLVYAKIQGSTEAIYRNISQLRYFVLLFDFMGAIAIVFYARKTTYTLFAPLLLLLNLAYMYNTIYWGQFDAINTTFILYSLLFALWNKPIGSLLMFVLAINMKLQSIIFIPPLLLLWVPLASKYPKKSIYAVFAGIAVQILLILPFILNGTFGKMWAMMFNAVDYYPRVSLNAYNAWYLILGNIKGDIRLYDVLDSIKWYGISYKHWGIIMFFATSAVALLPLALQGLMMIIKKQSLSIEHLRIASLSMALVALGFFYFNTQMHERYSYPALILFFVYGFLSKRYIPYILISVAYFLNLEAMSIAFKQICHFTYIFQPPFGAMLFGLCFIIGVVYLYKDTNLTNDIRFCWAWLTKKPIGQPVLQ